MIQAVPPAGPKPDCDRANATNVAEIAQQRLKKCSYPALRGVNCRSQEGVLVLTGVVPTFYMKQIAQTLMRSLNQVELIDNRLVVSSYAERVSLQKERKDACTQPQGIADHRDQ